MSFTRNWLSSWILDHSKFKTQPSYVRGLMDDIGERITSFMYGFATGETYTGFKKLELISIGTGDGTIPTGTGVQASINIEGKTFGGKTEAIIIDADGNEMQLTSKGAFLPNDTWLQGNAVGTGANVNIIKINTGNSIELGSTFSLSTIYPVGCVYTTTVATNPGTVFGFGTWISFGAGRVLVGKDTSGTFMTAAGTGGAETHTLLTAEMPAHTHTVTCNTGAAGDGTSGGNSGAKTSSSTGGDGAHNNIQPYLVVYFWTRTV